MQIYALNYTQLTDLCIFYQNFQTYGENVNYMQSLANLCRKKQFWFKKKIKYFRYMWKQCNFFRSMHSTTMKYQTYVKFFKSIPGPGEHHYVQIFVQKIVISITRFKSEMYIGQSLSIYFRQANPK